MGKTRTTGTRSSKFSKNRKPAQIHVLSSEQNQGGGKMFQITIIAISGTRLLMLGFSSRPLPCSPDDERKEQGFQ